MTNYNQDAWFFRQRGVEPYAGEPVEVALEAAISPIVRAVSRELLIAGHAVGLATRMAHDRMNQDDGPSGFLGRAKASVGGALRAVGAPALMVWDVSQDVGRGDAPDVFGSFRERGGDALAGAFGPDGAIGGPINLAPEVARMPVREGLRPLFWTSDLAYRNVVDRSVATLAAAGQISTDRGGRGLGGIGELFDASTWRDARTFVVENDLSAGESFAIMLGAAELPESDEEIQELLSRDNLWAAATTLDLAANFLLDPLDKTGQLVRVGRGARVGVTSSGDIDRFIARPSTQRHLDAMADMTGPEIRSRFFNTNTAGADISTMLEVAGDRQTRELVLRTALGDRNARNRLASSDALMADMLDSAFDTQMAETALARLADEGDPLAQVIETSREKSLTYDAAAREIYGDPSDGVFDIAGGVAESAEQAVRHGVLERRALRLDSTIGTMPDTAAFGGPAGAIPTRVRHSLTNSRWYQENALASPLRFVIERRPQRVINLHDTTGVEQIRRMTLRGKVDGDVASDLQARYAAALSPEERLLVADEALDITVSSILDRRGVDRDTIEQLISESKTVRQRARLELGNSIIYDADGRASVVRKTEGTIEQLDLPLHATQTPNFMPTANLFEIEKAATRIGAFKLRHPSAAVPQHLMESMNRGWKMSALMRLGWPLRVLSDERARMLGRLSVLGDTSGQRVSAWRLNRRLGRETIAVSPRGQQIRIPDGLDSTQEALVSADGLARRFYRGQEDAARGALQSDSMDWVRMDPGIPFDQRIPRFTDAEYRSAWERVVNDQLGKDAVARQVMDGLPDEQIVDWLRNSSEGRQHASRMARLDNQSIPDWVDAVRDQVDAYVPTPELRAAALEGTAKAHHMQRMFEQGFIPNLPTIHGGVLDNVLAGSPAMQAWNKAYDGVVRSLGSMPTNRLARQPTFRAFYDAEVGRQIGLLGAQGDLSAADIDRIVTNSRRYALRETRHLLYDLSETSNLAESLRFVSPFYNAFEEVATRWAGIAWQNPAVLGKIGAAHRVLEEQTTTDENGNRFIEMRVPQFIADKLPFLEIAPTFRVRPEQLPVATDLIYNQGPGVGPWVSIPVNEIVKERPELEQSVGFILPFGATGGSIASQILPHTARNFWTLKNGFFNPEDDDRFMATTLRILRDRITDYQLNNDDPAWQPLTNEVYETLWEDSVRDAQDFWMLRTAQSFLSPAQAQWLSPYQHVIDSYREASDLFMESEAVFEATYGFDDVDDWFISEHGPAYFALTESIRKSSDGLSPTIEAEAVRERYGDLLKRYPEFGGAIAGHLDDGEFNRVVYTNEFDIRDRDEFQKAPEVSLGWSEFIANRDLIDDELERRQRAGGSLSLTVAANADLAELNRANLDDLFERFPAWRRDYEQRDDGKQRVRNEAFQALAQEPKLADRPDWQGVAGYFADRDLVVGELLRRKETQGTPVSLDKHPDLTELWESMVAQRRLENPLFSALWTRWLERDELSASDLEE